MLNFRTILHPTDFSEPSRYAFGLARDLARGSGGDLLVIHVAPVPLYRKRCHRRQMEEALRLLTASDPTVQTQGLLLAGDPAAQIVCTANQLDCGLIVMGAGGRTGLGRLLRGSVSGAVQQAARCPVLNVRLPDREGRGVPDFAAGQLAAIGPPPGPAEGSLLPGRQEEKVTNQGAYDAKCGRLFVEQIDRIAARVRHQLSGPRGNRLDVSDAGVGLRGPAGTDLPTPRNETGVSAGRSRRPARRPGKPSRGVPT